MITLPIDAPLPEIVATLRDTRRLVLEAPPSAGKTTRVPRALLDAGVGEHGESVVLEPRRLAARMAPRRVAGRTRDGVCVRLPAAQARAPGRVVPAKIARAGSAFRYRRFSYPNRAVP